jgi:proteasome assembly chaperone (PAC2) family protein
VSDGLIWEHRPQLRRPVLVAAFRGWNDAAEAASNAASWLAAHGAASRFAQIDPEEHFDFQSVRPQVELVDGVTRTITWPANECFAVELPESAHDLVVVVGTEPNVKWRSFCRAVLEAAGGTGCEMIVTLGALLADVPHTRPVRVTGAVGEQEMMDRLGLTRSHYEGPTGIVGVLHDAVRDAGVPSASLWVPVPHYVAAAPNPVATQALLDRLGALLELDLPVSELNGEAVAWRQRVDEVVAGNDEVRDYVLRLEEQVDDEDDDDDDDSEPEPLTEADLRSGETLAADIERYLREQDT